MFPLSRREAWNAIKYNETYQDPASISIMTPSLPLKRLLNKPLKNTEELIKNHYNVLVYQILPYPPKTQKTHTY